MKASTLAHLFLAGGVTATHLSDSLLHRVNDVLKEISVYSYVHHTHTSYPSWPRVRQPPKLNLRWENGTMAQAHLEWLYPTYSVFTSSGNPFPSAGQVSNEDIPSIVQLAQITLQNRPQTNTSAVMDGTGLLEDGAAADPASLGVAVLLADKSTQGGVVNGVSYGRAAELQTNYLLYGVPRVSPAYLLVGSMLGIGSHRAE